MRLDKIKSVDELISGSYLIKTKKSAIILAHYKKGWFMSADFPCAFAFHSTIVSEVYLIKE